MSDARIRSCVTISLVDEARGGPFVFWDDLAEGCRKASELGFDAVEVFAPEAAAVNPDELRQLLDQHRLELAAVGTGGGWVVKRLQLCSPDDSEREQAIQFIRSIIDLGGPFGAVAIIGSMQGRWDQTVARERAFEYLSDALNELGEHARQYSVPLIYEPINRYETNMINSVVDGVELLERLSTDNVKLLADLFHMNIEDVDIADAIRAAGSHIGHVHFVDSNRRPAGCGHLDFEPIAAALKDIDYKGFVSAEALPYPNSQDAARLTIEAFRRHFCV